MQLSVSSAKINTYLPKIGFSSKKMEREENPEDKYTLNQATNYFKQYALPVGMLVSSAILIYMGIKSPNKNKVFNKAINQKLEKIISFLDDYKNTAKEIISKSYNGADNFTEIYKINYSYDIRENIQKVKNSKSAKEALEHTKSGLDELHQQYRNEYYRAGATVFDKFLTSMNEETNGLRGSLWGKRLNIRMKCEDIVQFVFEDFNNPKKIEAAKKELQNSKNLIDEGMENVQEELFAKALNEKSKNLADVIIKSRKNYVKNKQEILNAILEKFKTSEHIPQGVRELFENDAIFHFVKSGDLSKTTNENLQSIYTTLSLDNNINDIKLMVEILKYDKSTDRQIISNLEFLAENMEKICQEELLSLCSKDLSQLKPEILKQKLNIINKTGQKLGLASIEDIDKYLQQYNNYSQLPAKDYFNLITAEPEKYFV